jgi:hypothetical protein
VAHRGELTKASEQSVNEGAVRLTSAGVYHHARRFINHRKIIVVIEHLKGYIGLWGELRLRVRWRCTVEYITRLELKAWFGRVTIPLQSLSGGGLNPHKATLHPLSEASAAHLLDEQRERAI